MKRLFVGLLALTLCAAMLLTGCVAEETPGSPGTAPGSAAPQVPAAPSGLKPGEGAEKAAVILGGARDDYGFNYNAYLLAQAIEKDLGIPCVIKENVPPTADVEGVIEELIAQGCRIIFPSQFGYLEYSKNVAKRHPDVAFYSLPITDYVGENFSIIHGEVQDPWYVNGALAGLYTKTGKLGFVGSLPIPDVIVAIDAFALGAQSVNPDVEVIAVFTGAWDDTGLQTTSVNQLIDSGCDVIAPFQDNMKTIIEVCAKRGARAFGCNSDAKDLDPDTWMSATITDWSGYIPYMKAALEGNYETVNVSGGYGKNLIANARWGDNIPQEMIDQVEQIQKDIMSGKIHVFEGPVYNQKGELMFQEGYKPTIEEINVIDELVKGVTGTLN